MTLEIDKGTSDWIKLIAALMVAFHHYSQYAISELGETGFIYRLFSYLGGYLGVALFFFFSGYGLMYSEMKEHLSINEFLKKRIAKIYKPVIIITIVWLGVILCLHFFSQSDSFEQLTGIDRFTGDTQTWGG